LTFQTSQKSRKSYTGIKNIIGVASGKGGVEINSNSKLAVTLAKMGFQ
jgi:Mrp family chromosome partitioning ATPase